MSELRLGDTREIIKEYTDEYFDCIVSDIPYKIATGGSRIEFKGNEMSGIMRKVCPNDRLKNKWIKQEDSDTDILVRTGKLFANNEITFEEFLPDLYRVLKSDSHCYLMINSRNLKELQQKAEDVGFKFQNLLVWVKNSATPNHCYMQSCEYILMLRKGHERYINDMGTKNVFTYANILGNKLHPTEKPVELMRDLIINSTNEGDKVLDPFCGSGSTLLACKQTNREYYGIEIDEKYYNIAKKRLESEFVSREKKSEQITLF